ncbi:MAG: hypothetical protein ABSG45_03140 [Nitrososphaerales archaeon]
MSKPRVRSSRFARYASLMMVALGVLSIVVNTTVAAVIIALGLAMYLSERLIEGKVQRSLEQTD